MSRTLTRNAEENHTHRLYSRIAEREDDDGSIIPELEEEICGWFALGSVSPSSTAIVASISANRPEAYRPNPSACAVDIELKRGMSKSVGENINHKIKKGFMRDTTEARGHRAHDSPRVYGCTVNSSESIERHDFNACSTLKHARCEDTSRGLGICSNPHSLNLNQNLHKIADCLGRTTNYHNVPKNQHKPYIDTRTHHQKYVDGPLQTISLVEESIIYIEDTKQKSTTSNMPSQCLPRQRSRAIAIKRARPGEIPDRHSLGGNTTMETQQSCYDSELYDYATWRMYNRIIDHRRKNLSRQSHEQSHTTDASANVQSSSSKAYAKTSENHHITQEFVHPHTSIMSNGQQYYIHQHVQYGSDVGEEDDEIFDLEL